MDALKFSTRTLLVIAGNRVFYAAHTWQPRAHALSLPDASLAAISVGWLVSAPCSLVFCFFYTSHLY